MSYLAQSESKLYRKKQSLKVCRPCFTPLRTTLNTFRANSATRVQLARVSYFSSKLANLDAKLNIQV